MEGISYDYKDFATTWLFGDIGYLSLDIGYLSLDIGYLSLDIGYFFESDREN